MPKPTDSRKDRFRSALREARMTAETFAAVHGITSGHLSRVLSGERDSRVLTTKIDAFIKKYLRAVA